MYQGNGDVEGAITRYREAIGRKSDLPSAWLNMAVGLATLGRDDEAIAAYEVNKRCDGVARGNGLFVVLENSTSALCMGPKR